MALAYEDAGYFLFGPSVPSEHSFYKQLGAFGGTVEVTDFGSTGATKSRSIGKGG